MGNLLVARCFRAKVNRREAVQKRASRELAGLVTTKLA